MSGSEVGYAAGGVGLFLLGMVLMTDGLKAAAGPTLGRVLGSATATRGRGLLTGIVVTAMVQSSSAVTVAAIGFVNAGLLSFAQSLWVLFGSNVGTTTIGWLVAFIGFKLKVEAAALPLIGLGMALRLSGPQSRRGAIGAALAGFGVLFLGIAFLQQAFAGAGAALDLAAWSGHGLRSMITFVAAGLLLTVLMQSSAAALVVVLTLAEAGVLPITEAAAAVIGANIGTTVTAVLAAIGATANAKRAAAAHVLFNVLTGAVALMILPFLVGFVDWLGELLEIDQAPAASLALFHSVFNVLGVLLMWPLADRLANFLLRRFRQREEDRTQARHLDDNVASVPSLAVDALQREILRLGGLAVAALQARLPGRTGGETAAEPREVRLLSRTISRFVTQMNRGAMSAASADALARLLRVQRYYENCSELAEDIDAAALADAMPPVPAPLDAGWRESLAVLCDEAAERLRQLSPAEAPFAPLSAHQHERFEARYQALKAALLEAGARGSLAIETMETLLRTASSLRRALDQGSKAAALLLALRSPAGGDDDADDEDAIAADRTPAAARSVAGQ